MSEIRDAVVTALWQGRDPFQELSAFRPTTDPSDLRPSESDSLDAPVADIVNARLPRILVDVGAGDGDRSTTLAIARLFRERRHDGVVIAVDTWLGSWENWCQWDGAELPRFESGRSIFQSAFMQRVEAQGLQPYVVPLPMDDHNASVLMRRKRVRADVVVLDLRVARQSVESRLKRWWYLLRAGGPLLARFRPSDEHAYLIAKNTVQIFATEHAAGCRGADGFMRLDKPAQMSLAADSQAQVLAKLPEAAPVLDYEGEFGAELVLFLPYVTWLSEAGLLRGTRVVTYTGMRCFYDHLDCAGLDEKHALRSHVQEEERLACLPVKNEHTYVATRRSPFHVYPNLRRKFGALPLPRPFSESSKPLVVIHNKFTIEFKRTPVNFIGPELLDGLLQRLEQEFTVVYIRHGMTPEPTGYSKDDNFVLPFDERAVLEAHPDVWCFDDAYAEDRRQGGTWDLNTYKNVLYSRCYHFISSQGGGSMQMAFFSGSLLMILHREGPEEKHLVYTNGYYGFVASPPPMLAICLNDEELLKGVRLFHGSWVTDGQVMIAKDLVPLRHELSPWTLEQRRKDMEAHVG
jgi:hypothetical protein